ncbi:hypothetical protein GCM10027296_22520 [Chitinimonas naiadis]
MQDSLQIGRDGHGREGTDIGATGIADREPAAEVPQWGQQQSPELAAYLTCIAAGDGDAQHPAMHAQMRSQRTLAQDVRTLKLGERRHQLTLVKIEACLLQCLAKG